MSRFNVKLKLLDIGNYILYITKNHLIMVRTVFFIVNHKLL